VATLVLLCFTQNQQQFPSLSLPLALNVQMHKKKCPNEPHPIGLNWETRALLWGSCAFFGPCVRVFFCVAVKFGILGPMKRAMGPSCKVFPLIGFSDAVFAVHKQDLSVRTCDLVTLALKSIACWNSDSNLTSL